MNFLNVFEGWKSCMRKEKGEWLIKTSKAGCAGCSRLRRRHPTLLQHIQQPGELTSPRPSLLSPGNTGCIHIRLRCLHIAVYTLQSSITNQPKKPPFGYAVHIAAFPLIWATHAGASCELLKFNFLFVAKQRSSIFYSPPPNLPQWNFLWTNYFRPREGRWKLPRLQKYFQHNGIFLFFFLKKSLQTDLKLPFFPIKGKGFLFTTLRMKT